MGVSSRWDPTFEGLGDDCIHAFRSFVLSINFASLTRLAAELRGVDPSECFVNPALFQRGSCNVVFELSFADGTPWIAKFRLPPLAWLSPPCERFQQLQDEIAQSEIDTMQYIKSNTSIPIPAIFHYDLNTKQNNVGAPYILMEGIDGSITPSVFSSLDQSLQEKIYPQVARVLLQLSQFSFPYIGLLRQDGEETVMPSDWFDDYGYRYPPCESTSLYFENVYGTFRSEAQLSSDTERQAIAWLFEHCGKYILKFINESGPFPVCHGDLTSGNFLWDQNWNLVSVVDWTNSMTLPRELLGVIHEFYNDDSEHVRQARAHFATILAEEESKSSCTCRLSHLFSLPLMELLTIIKECNIPTSTAMYHVPRILDLLPETEDVSSLEILSPGFIARAKTLRENIKKGIRFTE